MKKILIVDTNYGFLSDVESRLILDEIENVEISTRNKIDGIHDEIDSLRPDELIIFANLLNSHPTWDFGVPVRTYARDAAGISLSDSKGFQCYGIVKNAGDLITAIEQNKIITVNTSTPQQEQGPTQAPPTPIPAVPTSTPLATTPVQTFTQESQVQRETTLVTQQPQSPHQQAHEQIPNTSSQFSNGDMNAFFKDNKEAILAALLSGQNPSAGQMPTQSGGNWNIPVQTGYSQTQSLYQQPYTTNGYGNGYGNGYNTPIQPAAIPPYNQETAYPNGMSQAEYDVARDVGNIRRKAKVISTYSAKGGVGKTTLSCELATFLSLTSNGRGKFRVCIADFNIDFGNVLNTLDFDPRKVSMTHWAANIRERMRMGERPEDIQYNQGQIEGYLQYKDKDGLYALLAPLTNAESMNISSAEVEVMLRNLIHNGGFDFVICDTGNNTRDTTYLALNNSDEVFLILTQSVNAANSNQSFLMTMLPINFDMSKIKTIINMVKPGKDVGASVEEVEESLVNPATRRPFPCIARIKDLNDVRNAENTGEPLVYHSTHEFTQSIASLAKHVVGENFVLPELPKQNMFSDLLGKVLGKIKK